MNLAASPRVDGSHVGSSYRQRTCALRSSMQIHAWWAATQKVAYRCRNRGIVLAWQVDYSNRMAWRKIPRPSGSYFIRIVCLFTRTGRSYRPKLSVQLPTLSANLPLFTWRLDFQSTVRNLCASQPPVVSPQGPPAPTDRGFILV